MKRNCIFIAVALLVALMAASLAIAETKAPENPKKLTELGKYITSAEAYEEWKAAPDSIHIIDCRTPEEYNFVGHAPMALNIPSKLWTGVWDENENQYVLKDNPDFESCVKRKFKTDDKLFVMCRSGGRSAMSANRLAKIGFTNVYNIIDGFEGDKIKDEDSYFHGKRMRNGWKNSGAPWTYSLDPNLIYKADTK